MTAIVLVDSVLRIYHEYKENATGPNSDFRRGMIQRPS